MHDIYFGKICVRAMVKCRDQGRELQITNIHIYKMVFVSYVKIRRRRVYQISSKSDHPFQSYSEHFIFFTFIDKYKNIIIHRKWKKMTKSSF